MNLPGDGSSAGAGIGCRGLARRFDRWAASYEVSQLQHVLYGPVHDAVLRYARRHVPHPGVILDVGCGTGRLPARLAFVYRQARVVGVDASTAMIRNAVTVPVVHRARFAASVAEQLPLPKRFSIWSLPRFRCLTGATRSQDSPRSAASWHRTQFW